MVRGWGREEVLHFKPAEGGVVIQKKGRWGSLTQPHLYASKQEEWQVDG